VQSPLDISSPAPLRFISNAMREKCVPGLRGMAQGSGTPTMDARLACNGFERTRRAPQASVSRSAATGPATYELSFDNRSRALAVQVRAAVYGVSHCCCCFRILIRRCILSSAAYERKGPLAFDGPSGEMGAPPRKLSPAARQRHHPRVTTFRW